MPRDRDPVGDLYTLVGADPHQIKATLLALCGDTPTLNKALKYHATLHRAQPSIKEPWICIRCNAAFDKNDNPKDACQFHPSRVAVDTSSEVWADTWGEEFDGLSEDEDMMEEFPDGYSWACCGRRYDGKPCVVGEHSAYSDYILKEAGKRSVYSGPIAEAEMEWDHSTSEDEATSGDDMGEPTRDSEGGNEPPSKKRRA